VIAVGLVNVDRSSVSKSVSGPRVWGVGVGVPEVAVAVAAGAAGVGESELVTAGAAHEVTAHANRDAPRARVSRRESGLWFDMVIPHGSIDVIGS